MKPVSVARWTSWDDAAALESGGAKDVSAQHGGWFGFSSATGEHFADTWEDYIAWLPEEQRPFALGLRDAIIKIKSKMSPDLHQGSPRGVPVFEDGSVGLYSSRGWADLMAAVWSGEEGVSYSYMDFYGCTGSETPDRPAFQTVLKRSRAGEASAGEVVPSKSTSEAESQSNDRGPKK